MIFLTHDMKDEYRLIETWIHDEDVQEWQPIETMPENEAVLIAGGDVLYPIVASKNDDPEHGLTFDLDAQGGLFYDNICDAPTHWMPLPDPPTKDRD